MKKNGTEGGSSVDEDFGEGFDDTLGAPGIRASRKSEKTKRSVYLPLSHRLHTAGI